VITVTNEMLAAFLAAWDHENRVIADCVGEYVEVGARDRAGLAAVLAIVERDWAMRPRRRPRDLDREHAGLGWPCTLCAGPCRIDDEHRPMSPGGDGLGYGPCVSCGELWPCKAVRTTETNSSTESTSSRDVQDWTAEEFAAVFPDPAAGGEGQ